MRLLFVRHGLSIANEKGVYQDDTDPLSNLGKQQANVVANRLKDIPIDRIVCSPLQRAVDTATIINTVLKKTHMEFCDELRENRNPSGIIGKPYQDPEALKILTPMRERFPDLSFKPDDGESFSQVRERAMNFIAHTDTFEGKENVLVVSHGMLIKMIGAIILFGKDLGYSEFKKFNDTFVISNTGVTVVDRIEKQWQIASWNDVSHISAK